MGQSRYTRRGPLHFDLGETMSDKTPVAGTRFGRLVVLHREPPDPSRPHLWMVCRCDCGVTKSIPAHRLRKGVSKSCGCLQLERRYVHGHAIRGKRTKAFHVWCDMRSRCGNPNDTAYANYGG